MRSTRTFESGTPGGKPERRAARSRRSRRGGTLALVLGMVVVVGLLGTGLLGAAGGNRVDAVRRQQSLQCFWGAESALALVRTRLRDASYRSSPTAIAFTSGLMRAEAKVVPSGNLYTVTAIGTNTYNRLDRRLAQDFILESFSYWDDFALFAGPAGIGMGQSVSIYGDVYCEGSLRMYQSAAIFESLYCQGNLTMDQSAAIYDEAFIKGVIDMGGSSIVYGGTYPFSSPANPYYAVNPYVPELNPAFYDSLLTVAVSSNSGLDFNADINLAGETKFVTGSVELKKSHRITSTPPGGVLVVRNSLNLRQSSQIGSNVTVICGDKFIMGQSTQVGPNSLIYARNAIEMKQTGIVATRVVLLTPGSIDMKQAAQASGFIYAGTRLDLSQSIALQGLVFAGSVANLSQGVTITYNKSLLPWAFPPGIVTNDAVKIVPQRWREL